MDLFTNNGIEDLSSLIHKSEQAHESSATELVAPMVTSTTVIQNRSYADSQGSKAIWMSDEIPCEDALTDLSIQKPSPRYEIAYKQKIGTEDAFFGMSGISPSSSDCSHIIVKVHCPGCTMRDLDLDVTKNRITVESKSFRLFQYLPQPVKHDKGSAKYDTQKEVLVVELPIDNDGINI